MASTTNPESERNPASGKRPYQKPRLESHGPWNAVTLAVSVPIGPGASNSNPLNKVLNPLDALFGEE